MRKLLLVSVMAGALAAVSLAAQAPAAKGAPGKWTPPRAADGHPDLSGVWANNSVTPTERPKEWAGKARLTDAELDQLKRDVGQVFDKDGDAIFQNVVEAALAKRKLGSYDPTTGNYNQFWLVDREIDHRTSLVTDPPDGRIPALTPEARERRAAAARRNEVASAEGGPTGRFEGPESRGLGERCISFGAPRVGAGYNSYFQFTQSRDVVGILQETIHDVRLVPLDGRPHVASNVRQWLGDSRGHWEGDTLVVETTNYSAAGAPNGATDAVKVTERFTRTSPDYLNWEITFDDARTWTRPWTMLVRLRKEDRRIYEYACHEGNLSMTGILAGAREQERQAASSAPKLEKQSGK